MSKINIASQNEEAITSLAQHYIMESIKNNGAIEIPVLNLTIRDSDINESSDSKSTSTYPRTPHTLRR